MLKGDFENEPSFKHLTTNLLPVATVAGSVRSCAVFDSVPYNTTTTTLNVRVFLRPCVSPQWVHMTSCVAN
jgi:hypothetical protein